MDPGDADEPDRAELASRVDELEQTVSKMLPDRRGVIKGLGAAAVGGAAVGGATGGASGQSAAGQVGTESEPVDVEAANVEAQSVSTEKASSNGYILLDGTEDLGEVLSNNPNAVIDLNDHTFEFSTFERPEPVTLINGTLKQAAGAGISSFFNDGKSIDGLHIENVTFDGNTANNSSKPVAIQFTSGEVSNLTVTNCEFIECQNTIYTNAGAEGLLIKDNRFQDCAKAVLANGDVHGLTVRDNVLAGSGVDGFVTTNAQGVNSEIRYLDNQLDDDNPFTPTRYTYRVNDATTVRVRGNVADSVAAHYDTSASGGSGDNISITNSTDVVVSHNHVKRSGDMCLTVENSERVRVESNDCKEADAYGISILNINDGSVTKNVCKNNAQDYSNRGLATEPGISINDSTGITVSENRCFDDQATKTQEHGLSPYRGTTASVVVSDNILIGNGTGGIDGTVPADSLETDNLT